MEGQAVLSAVVIVIGVGNVAATIGVGTADTVAAHVTTVMAASGTRQHGAPSPHLKNKHRWLSGMHPVGASRTLDKLDTLDNLLRANPSS